MDGSQTWGFDIDRLARDVEQARCKVLIMVNPHNPTGHSFSAVELKSLAEVVIQQDLLVISDEIYSDLVFPPRSHIPFASLDPEVAARTITLTSASKAFKLAGLCCTVAHVGPPAVRDGLGRPPHLFGQVSVPGVAATLAAWDWSEPWLNGVLRTLDGNRSLIAKALSGLGIGYLPPDAGFLAWLDCRALNLRTDPATFFRSRARVRLSPGHHYGPGGRGFVRLSFGTSPEILREICERMVTAVRKPP
jgi:cystathionine beta-lyase